MSEEEKAKMQALEAEVWVLRHFVAGLSLPDEDYFMAVCQWHHTLLKSTAELAGAVSQEAMDFATDIPNHLYNSDKSRI